MLDVHPPHEPAHGIRDFLMHLLTITIGLLIALSLEGLVEWRHHRHLVHEAEASMHEEIGRNAVGMRDALMQLQSQEKTLQQDVSVLQFVVKNGKTPEHGSIEIGFHIHSFDSVSWKTAQTTGALSYMPYDQARMFAEIYDSQDKLAAAEDVAARDAILGLGVFMNTPNDESTADPTGGRARETIDKLQVLEGQLFLIEQMYKSLDKQYSSYLQSHAA